MTLQQQQQHTKIRCQPLIIFYFCCIEIRIQQRPLFRQSLCQQGRQQQQQKMIVWRVPTSIILKRWKKGILSLILWYFNELTGFEIIMTYAAHF